MADRQDIDALLIDSLYGELDGVERERFEAHLGRHPSDRADLDNLRATRGVLRDANLAAVLGAAEPPSAISAKLLQEAARRAPRVRVADEGVFAWFRRWVSPILAYPGLSAAAALVVVGGAAGVMYAGGRFRTAQPTSAKPSAVSQAVPKGDLRLDDPRANPREPAVPSLPTGGNRTAYSVALDEKLNRELKADAVNESGGLSNAAEREKRQGIVKDMESASTGLGGSGTGRGGMLGDAPAKKMAAQGNVVAQPMVGLDKGEAKAASAPPGAARVSSVPAAPPKAPSPAAPQSPNDGYIELDKNVRDELTVRDADDSVVKTVARSDSDQQKEEAVEAAAERPAASAAEPMSVPPPPPESVAISSDSAPSREAGRAQVADTKSDADLTSWARAQHERMAKLVKSGKCTEAGVVGAAISRQAPEYYQTSVASDRAVRPCLAYVERARRSKSAASKASSRNADAPATTTAK